MDEEVCDVYDDWDYIQGFNPKKVFSLRKVLDCFSDIMERVQYNFGVLLLIYMNQKNLPHTFQIL